MFMESRFSHDFSRVRIHSDQQAVASAQAVNARAYTVGHNIVFNSGQYLPQSDEGKHLLAHELAHVVQQTAGPSLARYGSAEIAEKQADDSAERIMHGANPTVDFRTVPRLAFKKPGDAKSKPDPVVTIRINLTSHRAVFRTASGKEHSGEVSTDLAAGTYTLHPDVAKKKWWIPGTEPGLRFDVELENADPWALSYVKRPVLEVVTGGKEDLPIEETLGLEETVEIEGDPAQHADYVQNTVKAVGIFGWGGPFRFYRKMDDKGFGYDDYLLPRVAVHLDDDPLKETSFAINKVYKTREAAEAAVAAIGQLGAYAFYVGPGGHIFPTIISDTTAPYLCATLRKAIEQERADARAAANLGVNLALWYVGARFPIKTSEPPVSGGVPKTTPPAPPVAAAGSGGGEAFTVVEIGAGDLKAAIEIAKKGGAKVVAVDPAAPSASAIKELEALGGTFVKGTAESLAPGSAHQVFQYFPWTIEGSGSFITANTWRLVNDTVKLLKPNGNAYFVTESAKTAEYLAGQASSHGLKAVITETTAGAAAPGASGAGVPGFSNALKVWLVNIYK